MKKLYKSKNQKMLSGVCGGIAQYFNIDPTVVRLIWAIATVIMASFPGIIIYVICAIVIPDEPDAYDVTGSYNNEK